MTATSFVYFRRTEKPSRAYRLPVFDALEIVLAGQLADAEWIDKFTAFDCPDLILCEAPAGLLIAIGQTRV